MRSQSRQDLSKLVDSAGFLLQLAVEYQVHAARDLPWTLVSREYPWYDEQSGDRGFIDLVLESYDERLRLALECKKTRDASWVFLVDAAQVASQVRCLWTGQDSSGVAGAALEDVNFAPESQESSFCVVRGSGEDQSPMLERIAGVLLSSIDALAHQEALLVQKSREPGAKLYLPAIVTTASLHTCVVDPTRVPLDLGTLDDLQFTQVPMVRFRKPFGPARSNDPDTIDLKSVARGAERTVLVINSGHLLAILKGFKMLPRDRFNRPYSWDDYR